MDLEIKPGIPSSQAIPLNYQLTTMQWLRRCLLWHWNLSPLDGDHHIFPEAYTAVHDELAKS